VGVSDITVTILQWLEVDSNLFHPCRRGHMGDQKERAKEGTKDQLKGVGNQVGGRLRNAAGAVTGDMSEQVKGKVQEIKGKVQKKLGDAKKESARTEPVEEEDEF
jgi:uncharacterized protein YjbJ (UPF0337 family)